jgi:hypothetical protein
MFDFFFNDCIPNNYSKLSLTQCLEQTLSEYNDIKKSYPTEVDGIITSTSILNFIVNQENYSLADCIASMSNKDLRTLAYRIFLKYPIEKYSSKINEDELLAKEYSITVSGTIHTAINPVIVSFNNGVLFTLGLHNDLRKDILTISSNTTATVNVNNLFGLEINTTYIKNLVKQSLTKKLGNFDKFLDLIGANTYSSRFASGFEDASSQVQVSILEHVEAAINRNGSSKFFADGTLIKDVTPEKFDFRVLELRIFSPVAYRIYFYEAADKTYLALIEKKPADKKQSIHITASASTIKQMILLEK